MLTETIQQILENVSKFNKEKQINSYIIYFSCLL